MPFIGELESLHYRVGAGPEIRILDAHAIEYRPLRHTREIGTVGGVYWSGPVRPLHPEVHGTIYHRDPETAEVLFDLYEVNVDEPEIQLIARYQQNNVRRFKRFRHVILGAGSLALWNTSREEGWSGRSPFNITPFVLGMSQGSKLSDFVINGLVT